MAVIQVGVANSSVFTDRGNLEQTLSLVGWQFGTTSSGGAYTLRQGTTTASLNFTFGPNGNIISMEYATITAGNFADLSRNTWTVTDLNLPLAGLQANLANIMPLITGGNDFITGNDVNTSGYGGNQIIYAGAGNDEVRGLGSNDTIWGGTGNDRLFGGDGDDKLNGEAGDDLLNGGAGADVLDGGEGTDTANYFNAVAGVNVDLLTGLGSGGEAQGDRYISIENIDGGEGNDTLTGSNADNRIYGSDGDDIVYGMGGNDTLYGGFGTDTLYGGDGNDYLANFSGTSKLYGGAGDDFLDGFGSAAQMDGGDGWDMAVYNVGSAGVNVNLLTGIGSGGSAQGDTYAGIEAISSTAYNDTLTGTNGTNYFWSGSGDDQLFGMGGFDNLDGAAGNDSIFGGEGDDLLNGGDGSDTIHADAGKDTVFGGNGNDYVIGTGGSLTADGGAGNDQLYGGMSADQLSGGIGDDFLWGSHGNDTLYGGAGVDVVAGALGADVMYGGAGTDYFAMNYDIAYNAYDSIVDFTDGVDWLQLPEYARGLATVTNASFGCVVSIALADSSYNLYIAGVNAAQIADQIYYYGT
jgi:Ca2+-binding RTX toxin-like protein